MKPTDLKYLKAYYFDQKYFLCSKKSLASYISSVMKYDQQTFNGEHLYHIKAETLKNLKFWSVDQYLGHLPKVYTCLYLIDIYLLYKPKLYYYIIKTETLQGFNRLVSN